MQSDRITPQYVPEKRILWMLRAENVCIIFADVNAAHEWAERRGLEAWTVAEERVWRVVEA